MLEIGARVRIVEEPFMTIYPGVYTILAADGSGVWTISVVEGGSDFDERFLELVED
jgi:hypothetical protein